MRVNKRVRIAGIAGVAASMVLLTLLVQSSIWSLKERWWPQSERATTAPGSVASAADGAQVVTATYDFSVHNVVDLPGTPEKNDIVIDGRGTFRLSFGSADKDPAILHGRFRGVELKIQKQQRTPGKDGPTPGPSVLNRDFAVAVQKNGQISRVYLERIDAPFAESIVRQILSAWQFVRPEEPTAQSWQIEEEDAVGYCTARYERSTERSAVKQKDRCRKPAARGARIVITPEVKSKTEYGFSTRPGWVETVESDDLVAVPTNREPIRANNRVKLTLTSLENAPAMPLQLARLVGTKLSAPVAEGEAPRPPIGPGVDAAMVLSWLRPDDKVMQQRVQETLAQLFQERPDEIAKALELLRKSSDSQLKLTVLGALSDADSPGSQKALLDVARDGEVDGSTRESALLTLLASAEPQPETIDGLKRMANDGDPEHRETALMVLGGAARAASGSETGGAAAAEAVAFMQEGMQRATNDTERALYLDALGNTGSPAAFEAAADGLESPSPVVRASAVDALRHVKSEDADSAIGDIALTDPDEDVRRSAVQAMARRELDAPALAVLAQVVRRDKSVVVRGEAVTVLGRKRNDQQVRSLLTEVATKDPAEPIRQLARKLLETDPQARPSSD
jgi:HEAT repeat protein